MRPSCETRARATSRIVLWPLTVIVIVLVLGGGGAALASASRSAGDEITWVEGTLEDALARALERNVPLAIFACVADEQENQKFRNSLAGNKTLAQGLALAVPMFASNGDPPPGSDLQRHKQLMDAVYNRWVAPDSPDGSWPLPEVLIVNPTGEVRQRLGSGHIPDQAEVLKALKAANGALGGGVTDAQLPGLRALVADGRKHKKSGERPAEWRAWRAILAVTEAGPFATEAQAAMPEATAGVRAQLEACAKELTEVNLAERYKLLRDVVRQDAGTDLAKLAAEHVVRFGREKELRLALAPLRLAEDAEDLWHEYQLAAAGEDASGAERALKKLAIKKFAETPAGVRARAVLASADK